MEALTAYGHDLIVAIQSWRTPFFDAFFRSVAWLGSEDFLLVSLLTLWWVVDKRLAMRLLPLGVVAIWLSLWAKALLGQPRPFDPRVIPLVSEAGLGFPSTHALIGVVLWGFLAHHFRRRWTLWAAGLLAFVIGFSRMYLGVHFPHDVVGGWLLGLILLLAYLALLPWFRAVWAQRSLVTQIGLGLALPIGMLLLFNHDPYTRALTGVLAGAAVAVPLECRWIRFVAQDGLIWQKATRLLLGLVVLLALRIGLKTLLPEVMLADFLRYGLIGLWVTGVALWIFVMLHLAPHRPSAMVALTPKMTCPPKSVKSKC